MNFFKTLFVQKVKIFYQLVLIFKVPNLLDYLRRSAQ